MFIAIERSEIRPLEADAVASPGSPPVATATARGLHARLLSNAAARRLRAAERLASDRREDADYWKACCPMVVARAVALREERSFAPLP